MSTVTSPTTTTSLPFIRRRSSGAPMPGTPVPSSVDTNAFTAFFLPEATAATVAVTDAIPMDLTDSLLSFDIEDELLEEEEYIKCDLPESILPMSSEPSPRGRSASALSAAAIETATATLTSWFTMDDFVSESAAMEDEDVDEIEEDFLRDDYMQRTPEPELELMPTPEKLSLIAEEDFAQTLASVHAWSIKAFAWPWVRAN